MNPKFRNIFIIGAVAVIVAAGFGAYSIWGSDPVPDSFKAAREKGAFISEEIVQDSAAMIKDLERVNQLDKEKKYTEASALIDQLVKKNDEVRERALELAEQLEIMTKSLGEIRVEEARPVALEAINHELSVITHLLKYNEYVGRLFEVLLDRFVRNRSTQVSGWIEDINQEVAEINRYNSEAKKAFERFDSLVR